MGQLIRGDFEAVLKLLVYLAQRSNPWRSDTGETPGGSVYPGNSVEWLDHVMPTTRCINDEAHAMIKSRLTDPYYKGKGWTGHDVQRLKEIINEDWLKGDEIMWSATNENPDNH